MRETRGRDLAEYLAADDWEAAFYLLHERIQNEETGDLNLGDYIVLGQGDTAPTATIIDIQKSGILFSYANDGGTNAAALSISMKIGSLLAGSLGVDSASSGGRIVAFNGYTPLFFLR